jgi:hypothetical protein
MRWIGLIIGLAIFGSVSGGAVMASVMGFGLPGALDAPVNVRKASVSQRQGGAGFFFIYYNSGRRHHGGGYHGGK